MIHSSESVAYTEHSFSARLPIPFPQRTLLVHRVLANSPNSFGFLTATGTLLKRGTLLGGLWKRRLLVRGRRLRLEVDFTSHDESYPPQDLNVDVDGLDVTTVNHSTGVPNLAIRSVVKGYLYGPGSILVAHGDHEALSICQIKDAVVGYKKLIEAALKSEEKGEIEL
ncbi:uncharacterized protein N7515_000048 [Penicillium bovifimosum]|uniref:Uncharacterized protein n=1 Tax=Penicillium bovifimosum TaxID=126998 RepID=A0A9W9HED3_9EURO|nr:uncharacterized protein N7515_000048 [Penicillium bovifimosum]KAJ5145484.1 hypothetical protein N7515_000048 [Penicillium bovifimosum]